MSPELMQKMMMMEMQMQRYGRYGGQGSQMFARPIAPGLQTQIRAGTAQVAAVPGGAAGMRQVRAQLAGGGQIVRQGGMAVQSPGRAAGMRQVIRYVRQGDQIVRQGDLTNIINPQQPRQGMAVVRPIMGQQSVARTVSAVAGVSGVARESRWAPAGGRNMVQGEVVPGQLVMPNDIQMGPPPPPSHTVRPGPTGSS